MVGIFGTGVVYVTTGGNHGWTRYGDYVSIGRDATYPTSFDAFGYGVLNGTPPSGWGSDATGLLANIRYMLFGP